MTTPAALTTDRLLLRPWRADDRGPFAALNADPEVMEHFPAPMTRAESDGMADVLSDFIARHGWGLWATETRVDHRFIGFVGMSIPSFEAHFTPCVEIGWRLSRSAWGHGYATEAARTALAYGFGQLELDEVVSFTAATNERSQRVMQRLGMSHRPEDDFEHPLLDAGHPLRPHVLYRMTADQWPPARS